LKLQWVVFETALTRRRSIKVVIHFLCHQYYCYIELFTVSKLPTQHGFASHEVAQIYL